MCGHKTEKQTIGDFPVYLLVIARKTQKTLGDQVWDFAFAVLQRDKKEKHEKNVFFIGPNTDPRKTVPL